ncbi:MAG: uroporphyrinogen-III C-methyltransferase [Comamonas sp.]|nr:uroporphyrinogen-III C-methyltransferase [Comamonas sp.]
MTTNDGTPRTPPSSAQHASSPNSAAAAPQSPRPSNSSSSTPHTAAAAPTSTPTPAPSPSAPGWAWLALLLAVVALVLLWQLWTRLGGMQEQLARQAAQSQAQAQEASQQARQAQEHLYSASTRLSLLEARVAEVSLQRSQLEALVQEMSRAREDTLVEDLEAALRLALQQALLTGSVEPLLASLKSAHKRLERATQPRHRSLQQAIEQDMQRLRQTPSTDTASLLLRLDELLRGIDELPLQNQRPLAAQDKLPTRHISTQALAQAQAQLQSSEGSTNTTPDDSPSAWALWQHRLQQLWQGIGQQTKQLLQVSRIAHPEAALLSPEQGFFLRENLKLQLLNARLAVLARQYPAAQTDLAEAVRLLDTYFAPNAQRTHRAQASLVQLQNHLRDSQQPNLDHTFSALAAALASPIASPSPQGELGDPGEYGESGMFSEPSAPTPASPADEPASPPEPANSSSSSSGSDSSAHTPTAPATPHGSTLP